MFLSYELLLLLKLLLSTSLFAAQRLLWKPIFHHFVPHYLFFLKTYGYDDIQTSNEFLLIFTINSTYTPNIFTGEWVNCLQLFECFSAIWLSFGYFTVFLAIWLSSDSLTVFSAIWLSFDYLTVFSAIWLPFENFIIFSAIWLSFGYFTVFWAILLSFLQFNCLLVIQLSFGYLTSTRITLESHLNYTRIALEWH